MKAGEMEEIRGRFWAKNSKGRRSCERVWMVRWGEMLMALRREVKREVVGIRGRRRVEGMRHIWLRSSGQSVDGKGKLVRLTEMSLRLERELNASVSRARSQTRGRYCSLRAFHR